MPAQYLYLQKSAMAAQLEICRRRFGMEIQDPETSEWYAPFRTVTPFNVYDHPSTDFQALEVPEKIPMGMKFGEDWSRGKEREWDGETIKGRPSRDETTTRLFASNKPLKTRAEIEALGFFPDVAP